MTEHPPETPAEPSRRVVLSAGVVSALGVVGLAALSAPRPSRLGEPSGDEQLTTALAPHLEGHHRVAIALLDGDDVRFGGFGADETTEFEIGSVTKTFTGSLLAQAVERGEVTVETTVAEVLGDEAEGSAIADVTFAELATHTSGIPSLAPSWLGGSWFGALLRKDPYAGIEAEAVIADALASTLSGRGSYAYSNLAVSLEGQLLARIAGTDYATLVADRILDPMGLSSTYVPLTPGELRESATRGRTASGLPSAAWTMGGAAPAGGIRSTAADMAVYLAGMIDGSAPGAAAATEVLFTEGEHSATAMNWFQQDFGTGALMTWHNGITGGYRAFTGWDPGTGRGMLLLTDTNLSIDALAVDILTGEVAL